MQIKISQLLIFFFLYLPTVCFTQAIDSLFNLLENTEITHQKVDLWNEISNQQQPIGGKEAAENALNLAKQIDYAKGEADANYFLGSYHYLKDEQALAEAHMRKAIDLYDSLDRKFDKAETLVFLGEILYFEEKYSNALKQLQKAESIAIEIQNKTLLGQVYETKSFIYIDGLEDKIAGKTYLLKSNRIFEETSKIDYLIENYVRLASFFVENNQVDSSLFCIEKGEYILDTIKNASTGTRTYLSHYLSSLKGTCYAKYGKTDTAKLFIENSLPFFIENENWYSVAWAYTDLSTIALKEENYEEALIYAKKSIGLDYTKFSIKENTKLMRDAFIHINQDSFHFYNEKYISLLADKKEITQANEIQEVIKEVELDKKEKELITEKNNSRSIISFLSLLFLGGLFFYFYKNKNIRKSGVATNRQNTYGANNQNSEEEIDKLRQKVTTIERNLLSKEIDLERQQSSLDNTTQVIKKIATNNNPIELKKSIQKLSNQLEIKQNNKNQWLLFSQQFEQIHPDFFKNLKKHTPNLSIRELRLCAYGKLDMTNQEVAQILGIETSSVGKARHRLKKKLNLDKPQDLNQFLSNL